MVKTQVPAATSALPRTLDSEIQFVPACRPRLIPSQDLLDDEGCLLIDHNGKIYMLRGLPGGRLILTGWDGAPRHITRPSAAR